ARDRDAPQRQLVRGDVREVAAVDGDVGQGEPAELRAAEVDVLEVRVAEGDTARAGTRELGPRHADVLEQRAALEVAGAEGEIVEFVVEAGRLGAPRRARRTGHARSEARRVVVVRGRTRNPFRS